jgi:hypothetical protein
MSVLLDCLPLHRNQHIPYIPANMTVAMVGQGMTKKRLFFRHYRIRADRIIPIMPKECNQYGRILVIGIRSP